MNPSQINAFRHGLLKWYHRQGRHDLPWRRTDDAYAIWLSEVMLQQTQVKTVLERYYEPFLQAFPTLCALADAPEEAVLKQWQGLGYYSRARNLHRAAKACAPALPDRYEALLALPGIGDNTARALLAFAHRQPYAVLEANVKRVIHRLFALEHATPARLRRLADHLLDTDDPFHYNQAMMDLGALVCLPKAPHCDACPACGMCQGETTPEAFPAKKGKRPLPVRRRHLIALRDGAGRYHLAARKTRFLGGLYGFIEREEADTAPELAGHRMTLADMQPLGPISQTYSHFRLEAQAWLAELPHRMDGPHWHEPQAIDGLPLSQADLRLWRLLCAQKTASPAVSSATSAPARHSR